MLKDPQEARRIKREVAKYVLITSQLYKQGFSFPLLRCLGEAEAERAIGEVHEGACGSCIGGRALASKTAQAGFYWQTLKRDSLPFVKKCDKCQRYVITTTTKCFITMLTDIKRHLNNSIR
ncbi:hypothetical protein CR513_17593, partial [Mucuna pruriens]